MQGRRRRRRQIQSWEKPQKKTRKQLLLKWLAWMQQYGAALSEMCGIFTLKEEHKNNTEGFSFLPPPPPLTFLERVLPNGLAVSHGTATRD